MRSERRERGVNMYRIQKGVERPFAGEKMERFRTCTRSKKGGGQKCIVFREVWKGRSGA